MKIGISTHWYAPELNKAYLGPCTTPVPAPGVFTIAEFRKKLKPQPAFILATVKSVYDNPDYAWLNRTFSGRVGSRVEALSFVRQVRSMQVAAPAAKGRVVVSTRLVGG